jgi:hypothetical protein
MCILHLRGQGSAARKRRCTFPSMCLGVSKAYQGDLVAATKRTAPPENAIDALPQICGGGPVRRRVIGIFCRNAVSGRCWPTGWDWRRDARHRGDRRWKSDDSDGQPGGCTARVAGNAPLETQISTCHGFPSGIVGRADANDCAS